MSRKTLANRIDLGMTRIAGYTLFDEATKEFQELTPKEVKELVKQGQVNGLKLANDEIEPDSEGFNVKNLMVKSACGKFRPLYPTTSMVNCMYSVVRVIETDNGRIYETISNKSARVKVTPERLKILMEVAYVAGVTMRENGEIKICNGVTIQDKRTQIKQTGNIPQAVEMEPLNGVYIESEQDLPADSNSGLSVEQNLTGDKAIEKPAEPASNKFDNNLEVIFDSIDVSEGSAGVDTTIDNSLSKEQVNEKIAVSNRKSRKK